MLDPCQWCNTGHHRSCPNPHVVPGEHQLILCCCHVRAIVAAVDMPGQRNPDKFEKELEDTRAQLRLAQKAIDQLKDRLKQVMEAAAIECFHVTDDYGDCDCHNECY